METMVEKGTMSSADVLNLFPGIGADDVLTSKPANILSNDGDISFLDKPDAVKLDPPPPPPPPDNETPEAKIEREKKEAAAKEAAAGAQTPPAGPKADADKILDSIGKDDENLTDAEKAEIAAAGGRPKVEKNALTSYLKTKIEAGDFAAFSDWDEKKETIDVYLNKQPQKVLYEMLDANWAAKEKDLLERTPKEFFEALPDELQYAAKYAMSGGKDFKNLFAALSRVEQNKALDITTEEGQIAANRNYLQAINFGSPEEIEEEIQGYKTTNRLEKMANTVKPKLDAMGKQQAEMQIKQQEEWNKQQVAAAQEYYGNVHKALEKADLGGIKLDKKVQNMLYDGLTNIAYPSISGKPTSLLGHLLEKYQYVEPDFSLIAEVTYLLADPKGYRESVKQMGKNEGAEKILKNLKTEQQQLGNQGQAGASDDDDVDDAGAKRKKLVRPRNMFERT